MQQGQELLSFDVANSFPKLKKLDDLEKSLKKENKFLQDVSNSWINNDQIEGDFDDINLSPQKIILVKNIISLLKENQTIQKKIFEDKAKLLLKIRQGEDHESDIADEIKSQQKAIIYQQKYLISIEEKLSELQTRIKVIISENENFINQIEKKKEKYQKFKKNIFLNSPISGQVKEINIQNKRLEILPDKKLIAYLFIAYQDQKLIHKNMKLKVMVNNSEQNNNFLLTGQIILIGSDILPPNDAYPFYHLPVQISLETEEMTTKEQEIFLKPGIPVKVELPSPQKKSLLEVLYRNVLW
ncbi:HlyD family secretion protein [Gloeothece verrucosa]|uniref:HlyD family secretion protein n=1 Tax=Gloeothece verrucosa TaxID=2546359 RepID=UPI0012FF02B8|nr:HlyD family secretion protein [Gloeothece verrucosa]